jgi:SpoVK/Ycf46/Vps4 family AAA+-type ATPase
MTERHIARMFAQAERDEAVLLLDEADGFLRDRTRARHSWEVTQVNELLTRMEAYDGLFVCSTNLMEDLDPAALRRFDLKIRFDYLRPEQAWRLFRAVLKEQGCRVPAKADWLPRLARLERLTPGDFATLVRRQRLATGPLTAGSLCEGLRRELSFKSGREERGIGFTAPL